MLLYHPATDFYHCWMRFASLLCQRGGRGIEVDRARIIDFYLCFPHELLTCRLPASQSKYLRALVKLLPNSYENPYSIRQAFPQLKRVQSHVVMDMVSKDILVPQAYQEGHLLPETEPRVDDLLQAIAENWLSRDAVWHQLAVRVLLDVPLNGKDGLKHRSGLMEYKYDA